jgi:hypothetical protein
LYQGHYDQLVGTNLDFNDALRRAASMAYLGRQGHVVTITRTGKRSFINTLSFRPHFTPMAYWIAATDAVQEAAWRLGAYEAAFDIGWSYARRKLALTHLSLVILITLASVSKLLSKQSDECVSKKA